MFPHDFRRNGTDKYPTQRENRHQLGHAPQRNRSNLPDDFLLQILRNEDIETLDLDAEERQIRPTTWWGESYALV